MDQQVLVRISDGAILAGEMRGRDFAAAMRWAAENREQLWAAWIKLNERV